MSSCSRIVAALVAVLLALPAAAQEIVITFGGDTNFAGSRQNPNPDLIRKWGVHTLDEATATLKTEWTGDINFVNVETVVGDRNGAMSGKRFVFRSHPEQFRHLMDLGVNAFALANNHSWDHGWPGIEMTQAFFSGEDRPDRPLLFAGIGTEDVAFAPKVIEVKGVRIALSAMSFGSGAFSPTATRAGMAYNSQYDRILDGLREAEADIKMLSVHYGIENDINLGWGQGEMFRRAVEEAGVNLVIGHHPHVVRAVEVRPEDDAAIFYSLGNFLFIGGAEKDSKPVGHDYGLLGKAYFDMTGGRARLRALEAVPLKGVHEVPRHPSPARATAQVTHLNGLSERNLGALAARFALLSEPTPRGLACYGGPYGPAARARCCTMERSVHCDLPDLM
ncbi:CapA family protein [Psychromarinibacter sp. C21-152]|uniref:CapA family protein n=1 Tax=Psychromarinibacter sediminicola TaxID=3033385 RepID=A0AAE3NW08_9RHOB|nr:CapA family protein [Psychromarinibacter sediminicola]MDF0603274.1 CapA family protein [Psychromarinibacter sediminicola]